jgi:hypothetical protein
MRPFGRVNILTAGKALPNAPASGKTRPSHERLVAISDFGPSTDTGWYALTLIGYKSSGRNPVFLETCEKSGTNFFDVTKAYV